MLRSIQPLLLTVVGAGAALTFIYSAAAIEAARSGHRPFDYLNNWSPALSHRERAAMVTRLFSPRHWRHTIRQTGWPVPLVALGLVALVSLAVVL